LLGISLLGLASTATAHETIFGNSPRTIWKDGFEIEWETEFEVFKRYYRGDKNAGNPTDTKLYRTHFGPNFTYGITTDLSFFAAFPFAYAVRTDPVRGRESYAGLDDWEVGLKQRIYNDPFEGGSIQMGVFADFRLPTGSMRNMSTSPAAAPISFGDKGLGITMGLTTSVSSSREYLWADLSIETGLNEGDTAMGPAATLHLSYARRMWDLVSYDDPDLIVLVEFDVMGRDKGMLNGVRNPNSGYFTTHASLGFQFNLTNRHEFKAGYNFPLYRNYNGLQFVHEGEFKFTYSYLLGSFKGLFAD